MAPFYELEMCANHVLFKKQQQKKESNSSQVKSRWDDTIRLANFIFPFQMILIHEGIV